MLQGIMDFTTPAAGGADGKAIHLVALEDIADMSIFRMQIYANGETEPYVNNAGDLIDYQFPAVSVSEGEHIIVARDVAAMDIYMDISNIYDLVLDGEGFPTSSGNDAIELLVNSLEDIAKQQGCEIILSIGRNKSLLKIHEGLGYTIDPDPSYELSKNIK